MSSGPRTSPRYWPQAIAELRTADPVLATIIASYPDESLVSRDDAFGTLARAIVGQQISIKAAETVWEKLTRELGEVTYDSVVRARGKALRDCGLSQRKVAYLRGLADRFCGGTLGPHVWCGADDEAIATQLMAINGIGRWTVEMFQIFYLMSPDVLPVADIGLRKAIGQHYAGGETLANADIAAIAAPWRPWRSVATWYLWRSLDPIPVAY